MAFSRTHDISLSQYHVRDLTTFGETLTKAAIHAFPKDGTLPRYHEVHVLLLSWEDDSLGVAKEISELDDVLRQAYNYRTEQWRIPGERSHNALATRLTAFLGDYETKDNLLIVYYGGHGCMNDNRQCVWSW